MDVGCDLKLIETCRESLADKKSSGMDQALRESTQLSFEIFLVT